MLDVTVAPGSGLVTGQLHRSLTPATSPSVRFDLTRATWVEPVGLVMLAALAERQVRQGGAVKLLAPTNPDVARYLSRMHLGIVLDALGQEHDLPSVNARDTGELVELRRFSGTHEPDQLGKMLFDKTESNKRVARALHQSIAELGVNVPEHADLEYGYVAAQTTYGGTMVRFAVGDGGRGVAAGFDPAPTDTEALRDVLQGKSRMNEAGRGRGLAKAQKLVLELGGSLHMISGGAYRTHYPKRQTQGKSPNRYPGTLLQGTFGIP